MKKLIYTNESRLMLQTGYNNDWAKAVNVAIGELKDVTGELTTSKLQRSFQALLPCVMNLLRLQGKSIMPT